MKRQRVEEGPEEAKKRRLDEIPEAEKKRRVGETSEEKHVPQFFKSAVSAVERSETKVEEEIPAVERSEVVKSKVEEETLVGENTSVSEEETVAELLKLYDPILQEFEEKMRDSNGFHAIFLPVRTVASLVEAEYDYTILQEVSEAAVKFFNRKNKGSDFVYHSVVMGNYTPQSGRSYRVTFRGRPSKSNYTDDDDDDIKEFQAEAIYCPWTPIRILVRKCTVKTTREYPLYFEHEEVVEFSKEAVRFFNQKHEGSHFVLHSVGKGDYTPIVGATFRITFTAKASNEEFIKEFVARVKRSHPWVKPSRIIVRECAIIEEDKCSVKPESESQGKEEEENTNESSKAIVEEETAVVVESFEEKITNESDKAIMEEKTAMVESSEDKSATESGKEIVEEKTTVLESSVDKNTAESGKAVVEEESAVVVVVESSKEKNATAIESGKAIVEEKNDGFDPFLREYFLKLLESDEFLALPLPKRWNFDLHAFPEYDEELLEEVSQEVIKNYNEKNGSDFVFHSLIMASFRPCAGKLFRITFRARPSKSNYNDDDIKEFRAIAQYQPWEDIRIRIDECSVKPEREYPLYFEHENLKEYSEGAVKFFNQEHEGSKLVFRSVVKGSGYSPVPGYNVFVTFKASNDGDEDDIKEFEARLRLDFRWRKPFTGFTVFECTLKDNIAYPLKPETESKEQEEEGVGAD